TSSIDTARNKANLAFKYLLYFKLIHKKIKQYSIELQHTYNINKKGFLIRVLLKIKLIFSRQ
ncbi:uncharacterized protein BDR25DRAFT_241692, partial [Lindgomyces ingoldianus]